MAARADIEAGRAFVRLYMRSGDFEKGIRNARKLLGDFADSMKSLGRSMLGIGIASGAPLVYSINKFMEFDDAMRSARAAAGFTADEMKALAKTALDLSVKLGYTGTEVANMIAILARADFNIAELDKVTEAVLRMSRATGSDAVMAADMFAITSKVFGKSAEEAAHVVDAMTLAANRSIIGIENLGDSLKYSARQAADVGMSMEDTLAITAGLGRLGLIGETAGTALRRLTSEVGALAPELKKILGVDFIDTAGNIRPLLDSFEDLHEKIKDLPTAVRTSKLHEAFGILGISPATGISGTTISVRALAKEMKEATGVAATGARIINEGLGGAFRVLTSIVHRASIEVGGVFAEDLIALSQAVSRVLTNMTDFLRDNKEIVVLVAKAALAVSAIGGGLLMLGTAIRFAEYGLGGLLSIFGLFSGAVALVDAPARKIMTSARLMSSVINRAFSSVNTSADTLSRTIGRSLIGPLSSVGVMLRAALGGAVSLLLKLPSIASSAMGGLRAAFLSTAEAARQFWGGLTGTSQGFVGGLMLQFRALGAQLRQLGTVFMVNRGHLWKFIGLFTLGFSNISLSLFRFLKVVDMAVLFLKGFFRISIIGYQQLPLVMKIAYSSGSLLSYMFIRMYKEGKIVFLGLYHAVGTFITGLRGLNVSFRVVANRMATTFGSLFTYMSNSQRLFWANMAMSAGAAGARINYLVRSYLVNPLTTLFGPAIARVIAGYRVLRVFAVAAFTTIRAPAWVIASFTTMQRLAFNTGMVIRVNITIPFINGLKAIGAIGKETFRVIYQAAKLASMLTKAAWIVIGGPISRALKLTIGGAFIAIRAIGTTAGKGIASGFRGITGGVSAIASLLGMVGGPLGTIFSTIPSIMMLAPSLFGLLNPLSLILIALGAGAVYWFKYSESGKAALKSIIDFLKPMYDLAVGTFKGIKDSLEAGDVGLAAKIALAGLKAIALEGLKGLSKAMGDHWGGALAKISGKLAGGDFKGAWQDTLKAMSGLWDVWSEGVVSTFSSAADYIASRWEDIVKRMANTMIEFSSHIDSDFMDYVMAENVAAEKAKAERLRQQAQAMGLSGQNSGLDTEEAIANFTGVSKKGFEAYLAELEEEARRRAAAGLRDVADVAEGGGELLDKGLEEAKADLEKLKAEAAAKAEAVKKKQAEEEARLTGLEGMAGLPGVPGEFPGLGSSGKYGETATFSAYALAAQGAGGPVETLKQINYKTAEQLRESRMIRRAIMKEVDHMEDHLRSLKFT